MRQKLKSRQPRQARIEKSRVERSLYETVPDDSWEGDPDHRWSRRRYTSFWPYDESVRVASHSNEMSFAENNRPVGGD